MFLTLSPLAACVRERERRPRTDTIVLGLTFHTYPLLTLCHACIFEQRPPPPYLHISLSTTTWTFTPYTCTSASAPTPVLQLPLPHLYIGSGPCMSARISSEAADWAPVSENGSAATAARTSVGLLQRGAVLLVTGGGGVK